MPELRPIDPSEVRKLCPDNFSKGASYFRDGALSNGWRTSSTLHASVAGSASQPYEATIGPRDDGTYWARCSCPAARRQGICKHAAAILVAWAEKPGLFSLRADPEPQSDGNGAPKLESDVKRVRAPKADRKLLLAEGLDKAESLLVEIASQGLLAVTREQMDMIGSLAETLEAHKLRRLARQVGEIHRAAASTQGETNSFDEQAWARLLSDSWFVLMATRKALEREDDDARKAELEELVGKTWLEKDLQRVIDLKLVELAYQTAVLPSGFRVETSYLLELGEGILYTEKQITPVRLKDTPRKRSYSQPLQVSIAGIYPGFPPRRIKLIEAEKAAGGDQIWDRVLELAEGSAATVRQRLIQSTGNLVAPQEAYCLLRPSSILVQEEALYLLDEEDKAIPVGTGGRSSLYGLRAALVRGPIEAALCRVYFTGRAMEAEPLSVILGKGAAERLIRITA